MSYGIAFHGKVCNYWPTFSSEKRAWDYLVSELEEAAQDYEENGVKFDLEHVLSCYEVVEL